MDIRAELNNETECLEDLHKTILEVNDKVDVIISLFLSLQPSLAKKVGVKFKWKEGTEGKVKSYY